MRSLLHIHFPAYIQTPAPASLLTVPQSLAPTAAIAAGEQDQLQAAGGVAESRMEGHEMGAASSISQLLPWMGTAAENEAE